MPVIHRTHVRISRVRPPLPRRVRHHHFCFGPNVRVALAQRNRIPITLRHLPPIRPGHPGRLCQHHFWLIETLAKSEKFCCFAKSVQKIPVTYSGGHLLEHTLKSNLVENGLEVFDKFTSAPSLLLDEHAGGVIVQNLQESCVLGFENGSVQL